MLLKLRYCILRLKQGAYVLVQITSKKVDYIDVIVQTCTMYNVHALVENLFVVFF